MRKLLIIGAGGFGKEVAWTAAEMNRQFLDTDRWRLAGYADDNASLAGSVIDGYPVHGSPESISHPQSYWFHCALGNNAARRCMAERCLELGMCPATIIHPSATIAPGINIGTGVYVGAGSILNPGVSIGDFVLVNQRVAIGHDSTLENYVQANPGAQINGACLLKQNSFIGSNASMHPGITLGCNSVIGSNSQALRNIPDNHTANGVPANSFPHTTNKAFDT